MNRLGTILLAAAATLSPLAASAQKHEAGTFTAGDKTFLLNGEPFVVHAAELHYPRIPRPYWRHRLQMCKALGMNAVCLYVFWNAHEQQEGKYDFTGNLDVAEFCRMAQSEGLYVILRPGPYVCAEWDMGGLPWWLLKKKDVQLRKQDPYFMEKVSQFEGEVGRQLGGLTIDKGGPIILVQVENEYGAYGEDKDYVSAIRDTLRHTGFENVTMFQCDWSSNFSLNGLDDLVWTMNFGTWADPEEEFKNLKDARPNSPLMCSEYWSGWFDKWGAAHETRPADDMTRGIETMAAKGISFSLYMTHGGTSFGHWAGANTPGYLPDVTSYDYDAPISESGMATPKYYALRDVMQKHSKTKLPRVPKMPMPTISIPTFKFTEFAPLASGIRDTLRADTPTTFEDADMGWGAMVYATTLPEIADSSTLTAQVHDYGLVYVDGQYVGAINRVKGETTIRIPSTHRGSRLEIVVDGMGRINFGRDIMDYKGIVGDVVLTREADGSQIDVTPKVWESMAIPDDYSVAIKALEHPSSKATFGKAGYYRATFNVKKVGDTFISLEAFGKGHVYVNGHHLGRFWNIGPQQTLYLPGCWLRKGANEVVVLDYVGPEGTPTSECVKVSVLDKVKM